MWGEVVEGRRGRGGVEWGWGWGGHKERVVHPLLPTEENKNSVSVFSPLLPISHTCMVRSVHAKHQWIRSTLLRVG